MKNIYVLDPICRNNVHFSFNLSILKNVDIVKNESKINFACYSSNSRIIDSCNKLGISVDEVKETSNYIIRIFRFFLRSFYSKTILNADRILLLAIDNTLLPLLFISNILLLPFLFKKITIISHNNLYSIKSNLFKRIIMRLFLFSYQPKVLLLYPSLVDEFKSVIDFNNLFGCFHQNYREEIKENYRLDRALNEKIDKEKTILITGGHSNNFIQMINSNIDKIKNETFQKENRITIKYISNIVLDVTEINLITFERVKKPNDMNAYYNMILNVDFVLFPINEMANSRASGVLVDALSVGTNFIGPNIGHFKDINSKYDIGFLYNNYSELFSLFNELCHLNKSDNFRKKNINRFYRDTDPMAFSKFLIK